MTQLTANRNMPNMGGWQDRHDAALTHPVRGFERAFNSMLQGWAEYAETHQRTYESSIGDDGVIGVEWEAIGQALLGLLNGELGRLDAGTLHQFISDTLRENGLDPEVGGAIRTRKVGA